ncbi:MAG: 4Fe-4S binding protein [Bacillota bacterium]
MECGACAINCPVNAISVGCRNRMRRRRD